MSDRLIPEEKKERIISLFVLIGVLLTIWYMLDLVLLTFILTFVFYHLFELVQRRYEKIIGQRFPDILILLILYFTFFALVSLLGVYVFPKLLLQINIIANALANFDIAKVHDVVGVKTGILLANIDFNAYISKAGALLADLFTKLSGFLLKVLISLILSFAIIAEKKKIQQFGQNLSRSSISFLYEYFITYGGGFTRTFGQVMKVQVTIALINALLTTIALSIFGYPAVGGLGFMVFLLGLIPVAGVIVSLIPLSVIGFSVGGIITVVKVIIFIAFLHAFEAYFLNPKLMSRKTKLPVSFVFLILLIAEHYMGVWGLLVGVPVFIFLMTAFKVDYQVSGEEKTEAKNKSKEVKNRKKNKYNKNSKDDIEGKDNKKDED